MIKSLTTQSVRLIPVILVLALNVFTASSAYAVSFEWKDIEGSIDSTFSAGASWRTQEKDYSIIAKRNNPNNPPLCPDRDNEGPETPVFDLLGGCVIETAEHNAFVEAPGYFSQNGDNGNINYDKGDIVASAFKITSDISANWGDYGLFARLIGFYDWENDGRQDRYVDRYFLEEANNNAVDGRNPFHGPRVPRSKAVDDAMVFNAALEDAYIYGLFSIGERDFSWNLGRQVISWGESLTFPINSVSSANVPNVTRLVTPGGDLKELLDPVSSFKLSFDLTDTVSTEMFYMLEWKSITENLPPRGSFFSTSDVAGPGGTYAMLSFGKEPENPFNEQDGGTEATCINSDLTSYEDEIADNQEGYATFGPYQADRGGSNGRTICLAGEIQPDWKDQWGVQLKWYAEALNDTEFGFYYMNYHSRLPYAGFIAAQANSLGAILDVEAFLNDILGGGAGGGGLGGLGGALGGLTGGLISSVTDLADAITGGLLGVEVDDLAVLQALSIADTVGVFLEYPEDIEMFGMSFNTNIGGVSYSGEFTYRPEMPIQIHQVDLTLYALATAFSTSRDVAGASFIEQFLDGGTTDYGSDPNLAPGDLISGYLRLPVSQGSLTTLWSSGQNPFGADQWLVITDTKFVKINGMPDRSVIQFDAPGTDTHAGAGRYEFDQANPTQFIAGWLMQNPTTEDLDHFVDSFSWGYRVLTFLKYNNVLWGSNLNQLFGFFHDVNGNSPGPAGDFVEGRKRFLVGSTFDKGPWTVDFKYTVYTGAAERNQERDRDHFSAAIKYTF